MGSKGKLRELLEQLKDNLARNAHVEDQGPGDLLLEQLVAALEEMSPCRLNLVDGEPVFEIRGQDLSASLVVDFWAYVQLAMQNLVAHGHSTQDALRIVEGHFREHMTPQRGPSEAMQEKIEGARTIAQNMRHWLPKKLAD